MTRTRFSWLVLAVLLAVQAALALPPRFRAYSGDEVYYVTKAAQWAAHHRFDRATSEELDVEQGRRWGTADWRPPGYPMALAVIGGGRFEPAALRARVGAVQFAAIAAVLLTAFALFGRGAPLTSALLLGIVPASFEYLTSLVPDALTAALTFFGAVALWRAVAARRAAWAFAGALLTAATFLLRPESIVVAVVTIAAALLFARFDARLTAAAAAALLLVCAAQYGYRMQFTGERFPPFFSAFHTKSLGAVHWVNTRLLTEHEGLEEIAYALGEGRTPRIPPRAVANAREQRELDAALALLRRDGANSEAVDGAFERMARERVREAPVAAGLVPRVAHAGQLWINLYTNSQTLAALAGVPRAIRLPILLALLLAKCAAAALFCAALVRARSLPVALLATTVIVRTLLIAAVINMMEHRYVTSVWPALLACACAALSAQRGAHPEAD
jgi:hypothetical protein